MGFETASALVLAYLLGSLPTALLASRWLVRLDIRLVGDGNMGARNITPTLGLGPAMVLRPPTPRSRGKKYVGWPT